MDLGDLLMSYAPMPSGDVNRQVPGSYVAPLDLAAQGYPAFPPQGNFRAAMADMRLNPQEAALYQRHLMNLYGPGGVDNPDRSRSTLFQMSFGGPAGRTFNVPTVYGGQILPPDAAVDRAYGQGIYNFPSYRSQQQAEDRYGAMHGYMERDTADYLARRGY